MKHFKVIFEISRFQISAQRSLIFMKVEVFFTPWGKCRDTGIIRNYNVTDSSHILSSSFFTNQRTVRCYTLCSSQPRQINRKQNKDTQAKLCKLSSRFSPFNIVCTRHVGAPGRINNLKLVQTHTL